jgi:acyl-CoA thioester hydrolase
MTDKERVLQQGYADTRVRVRYAETDQMGIVYHANYLVWFEVGRVEMMRQIGLEYREMESEEGAMIAVVEAKARYKAPARYDDELTIRTRVAGLRGPILRYKYKVIRVSDQLLLAEGETVHIVVDRDMKRRTMPERYVKQFGELMHHLLEQQSEEVPGKEWE